MKKKIIIASATVLFAVATMFNMNLLQGNSVGDVSLDDIAVMAQANGESAWDAFKQGISDWWNSEIYDCSSVECIIQVVPGVGAVWGHKLKCTGGSTVAHCTSCWSACR